MAVKVTLVPAQITLPAASEAIETLAGKFVFTVVVISVAVAGDPVAQVALEVIDTVTASPSFRVVVV